MAPSTVRRGAKKNDALTLNCYERSKTSSASTDGVAVSTRVFVGCHTLVCVSGVSIKLSWAG